MPRIVVVEDDASMRQAIERILDVGGFQVAVFASAEEALDADITTLADCLVLDIHLPAMSGIELYGRLTQSFGRPPVVFITAHDEPAIRTEAENMGASSFLLKPFSGRTLLDAVTQAASPD